MLNWLETPETRNVKHHSRMSQARLLRSGKRWIVKIYAILVATTVFICVSLNHSINRFIQNLIHSVMKQGLFCLYDTQIEIILLKKYVTIYLIFVPYCVPSSALLSLFQALFLPVAPYSTVWILLIEFRCSSIILSCLFVHVRMLKQCLSCVHIDINITI